MLPAGARLRRSPDFAETLKHGRRAGRPTLVVTLLAGEMSGQRGETGFGASPGAGQLAAPAASPARPALVGFVVGRRVGGAVVRNRVRRRLQHLMFSGLDDLPPGSRTVVRALPGAERLSYADLDAELSSLLARVRR